MDVKRILVIRFSSLGDIILLTPLFRETKKRFAAAKLDFLTSTTFSSVCQGNPHLDSIVALDRKKGRSELAKIATIIKRSDYDLILDAHCSLRSRFLLCLVFGPLYWLNPAIKSINKRSWKRNLLLVTKVNLFHTTVTQRAAYCRLLDSVSSDRVYSLTTELFPGCDEHKRVQTILHDFKLEGKTLVALGPGASFPGKCWPKESFLKLADKLRAAGYSIVLFGGEKDTEPAWIVQNSEQSLVNVSGKLSFLQTAAFLQKCAVTISNDSAIVHFSEAVGTPAISIFGPTVKEFGYGPFLKQSKLIDIRLPCRPCSRNGSGKCRNPIERQCLIEITVESVFKEALIILKYRGEQI
jgi:heptosyltransferase-2